MSGNVTLYDIAQVVTTFGPIPLVGFADGEMIRIEYDQDQETSVSGGDGDVVRVPNKSRKATATVRLLRGSPAAAALRVWRSTMPPPLDQAPFVVKDVAGLLTHGSLVAWISAEPPVSLGTEAPIEEWKFTLASFTTDVLSFA
jgi:hypothetical protein